MSDQATRPRGRPAILNREDILRTAFEILREHGREGVTIRAVADRLGCGTMSLYSHIENKNELLEAVGARALEDMQIEIPKEGDWSNRLIGWMHSLESYLLDFPEVRDLIAEQRNDSPALMRVITQPISILVEQGVERPVAVKAIQGLLWVALGYFLIYTLAYRSEQDSSPAEQLRSALGKIPEEEQPEARENLPHLVFDRKSGQQLYADIVRRSIKGLAQELNLNIEKENQGG